MALCYGVDDRDSRVRFPAGAGNFSLHHRVQNDSGAHPASYPMGTRGSFPAVNRPGCEADHSLPSSIKEKEWVELYLHSPNTPSWRGAQLNHRDNFTFYLYIDVLPRNFLREIPNTNKLEGIVLMWSFDIPNKTVPEVDAAARGLCAEFLTNEGHAPLLTLTWNKTKIHYVTW
jgi:hypothetical protein